VSKVIVYHGSYGCETGCCGHWVQLAENDGRFQFEHPWGRDPLEFARELVAQEYGADHVADLDWEHCVITDDE
jgi:hypothetical protein